MKRLTKSTNDVMVSGVLAGIAEYLNVDPTVIRMIYVLITVGGFGSPVLLYILLAIIMPEG